MNEENNYQTFIEIIYNIFDNDVLECHETTIF
jgi:hypothetical protein